jgi:hypothetical protein
MPGRYLLPSIEIYRLPLEGASDLMAAMTYGADVGGMLGGLAALAGRGPCRS